MAKIDDIKKAFVDLMIEKGIRNVNMNDVFLKAQTGSGTFYHYYKSKEDLISNLFADYVSSAINSIKVEIPSDVDIKDIKPFFMMVLSNITTLLTEKRKTIEVLSILGPEFNRKQEIKMFGDFKKFHDRADSEWQWFRDIILKGQQLHQIVDLPTDIIGRMVMGTYSRLFMPHFKKEAFKDIMSSKEFDEMVKKKTLTQDQIKLIKECIWNMIAIH